MKVVISSRPKRCHWHYFKNIFGSVAQTDNSLLIQDPNVFPVTINDIGFNVDYGDKSSIREHLSPCLKFHIRSERTGFYPFPPVSFIDWGVYAECLSGIEYKAMGNIILANQVPRAGALVRRTRVQAMLVERFGKDADLSITPQREWWQKINSCLVAVCVPGCFPNILDRGQFQLMALGCCTVSPRVLELLPFGKTFQAGIHYIECSPDYSDLVDKIEWCKNNREACVSIGKNAKALFGETSTPPRIIQWLEEIKL